MAWHQPSRSRLGSGLLAALLAVPLAACSSSGGTAPERHAAEPRLSRCAEPRFDDVLGRAPSYLPGSLDDFANSGALCGGVWSPRTQNTFVPQGLVVRGRTAWVGGYHERSGILDDFCRVVKIDLRTGRELATVMPVHGPVAGMTPDVECRHAGGLALDEHGLWMVESQRMWLLDPDTLQLRRSWWMKQPVQGSFAVIDDRGRLGLGRHRTHRREPWHPGPAQVDWLDIDHLLSPGVVRIDESSVVAHRRIPRYAQGAFWGTIGGKRGLWLTLSVTKCGVLVAPDNRRYGFVPGAEGAALAGSRLWVVSESTARSYWRKGGRPVVPTLARLDVTRISQWATPVCRPNVK